MTLENKTKELKETADILTLITQEINGMRNTAEYYMPVNENDERVIPDENDDSYSANEYRRYTKAADLLEKLVLDYLKKM